MLLVMCALAAVALGLAPDVRAQNGSPVNHGFSGPSESEPVIDPIPIDPVVESPIELLRRTTDPETWNGVLDGLAIGDARRLRIAVQQTHGAGDAGSDFGGQPDELVLALTEVVQSNLPDEIRTGALTRLSELEPVEAFRAAGSLPTLAEAEAFEIEHTRQVESVLPTALDGWDAQLRGAALRVLQAHDGDGPLPLSELEAIALYDEILELRLSALEILAADGSQRARSALLAAQSDPDTLVSDLAGELLDAR